MLVLVLCDKSTKTCFDRIEECRLRYLLFLLSQVWRRSKSRSNVPRTSNITNFISSPSKNCNSNLVNGTTPAPSNTENCSTSTEGLSPSNNLNRNSTSCISMSATDILSVTTCNEDAFAGTTPPPSLASMPTVGEDSSPAPSTPIGQCQSRDEEASTPIGQCGSPDEQSCSPDVASLHDSPSPANERAES